MMLLASIARAPALPGDLLALLLALASIPLLVWWGLWFFFVLLASMPRRPAAPAAAGSRALAPRIDILIPAHNEELLLPRLLHSLAQQTGPALVGRILVVADHCSDSTAALARQFGAAVLERNAGPRGKPAALREGIALLQELATVSPHRRAVLILDADCTLSPDFISLTSAALAAGAQVTQAAYVLDASPDNDLHSTACLAFALKNEIRPRGMARLGIPVQLFGTGMCFRADLLRRIHFADHLTEDLALSYDLLRAGVLPRFVEEARVRSPLPASRSAMSVQKLRWETGQIHTWSILPVMLIRLLFRSNLRAAIAVLDWSAPPLAMAVLYQFGVAFAVGVCVAERWTSPWLVLLPLVSIAFLVGYLLIGSFQISGAAAVGRLVRAAPRFLFWKLSLYSRMALGRTPKNWQRTPRTVAEMK